jgi:hypothetical protein
MKDKKVIIKDKYESRGKKYKKERNNRSVEGNR